MKKKMEILFMKKKTPCNRNHFCVSPLKKKKNITSVQCLDLHKMSTSMYEVFNWGHVNESRPKRLSLFAGASEINIDDPPPPVKSTRNTANTRYGETFVF